VRYQVCILSFCSAAGRKIKEFHSYEAAHNRLLAAKHLGMETLDSKSGCPTTVGGPAASRLRHTARTGCYVYTLLSPDDGLLARPKHVEL
jgi:hypothetical protein